VIFTFPPKPFYTSFFGLYFINVFGGIIMPGFDPSLDKQLFSESVTLANQKLIVSVMAYNDGAHKMQIGRERISTEGEGTFAKLGRLTLEEAKAVQPLIAKAIEFMEKE
jgi:hypothetical protein